MARKTTEAQNPRKVQKATKVSAMTALSALAWATAVAVELVALAELSEAALADAEERCAVLALEMGRVVEELAKSQDESVLLEACQEVARLKARGPRPPEVN